MKNRNMLQKWLIILFLGLIIQAVSAQNINVHGIITDETMFDSVIDDAA